MAEVTPHHSARLFAALAFTACAIFLVSYTWLPSRSDLQREQGTVSHISRQLNTWYEVEVTTASGARVSCRTRRGWPLLGPDRCPLEALERYLDQTVTVAHDGQRLFEVTAGDRIVMDYAAHQQARTIAVVAAVILLALAFLAWKR